MRNIISTYYHGTYITNLKFAHCFSLYDLRIGLLHSKLYSLSKISLFHIVMHYHAQRVLLVCETLVFAARCAINIFDAVESITS